MCGWGRTSSSIRSHRRTAIRVFLEHPDLASSGYKPLVYKQLSEDASWFAYRHHGQAALDDMTEAVTALAHAIVTPGYSATAAGALARAMATSPGLLLLDDSTSSVERL